MSSDKGTMWDAAKTPPQRPYKTTKTDGYSLVSFIILLSGGVGFILGVIYAS